MINLPGTEFLQFINQKISSMKNSRARDMIAHLKQTQMRHADDIIIVEVSRGEIDLDFRIPLHIL